MWFDRIDIKDIEKLLDFYSYSHKLFIVLIQYNYSLEIWSYICTAGIKCWPLFQDSKGNKQYLTWKPSWFLWGWNKKFLGFDMRYCLFLQNLEKDLRLTIMHTSVSLKLKLLNQIDTYLSQTLKLLRYIENIVWQETILFLITLHQLEFWSKKQLILPNVPSITNI